MELLKLLSASEIAAQIVSFLLLLFALRLFAWKPVLGALDKRKERIAAEFKKIEGLQSGLNSLKAEYEKKLGVIEDTARLRIQEGVREAGRIAEGIKNSARLEADKLIQDARANIRQELSRVKDELKEKIVELTLAATENIIREKYTGEDDRRTIADFLDKLDEIK